jgi:hypothetical protein
MSKGFVGENRFIGEKLGRVCYPAIKLGTQFGTQKGAERAVEAVDALHAVRILLSEFSAY